VGGREKTIGEEQSVSEKKQAAGKSKGRGGERINGLNFRIENEDVGKLTLSANATKRERGTRNWVERVGARLVSLKPTKEEVPGRVVRENTTTKKMLLRMPHKGKSPARWNGQATRTPPEEREFLNIFSREENIRNKGKRMTATGGGRRRKRGQDRGQGNGRRGVGGGGARRA